MRILVHTIFYSPDLTGTAKYTAELCEWLAARGHEVIVIAPPPYYPAWKVNAPYSQWRFKKELLNGVTVYRAPLWLPRKPGGLARILYSLSFAVTSLPLLLLQFFRPPDVVFVVEPSLLNAPAAWLLARATGGLAWLHVQDFEIDLAFALRQITRGAAFLAALESWLLRRFAAVSSISPRMLKRAALKSVPQSRLVLLPNWFDSSIDPACDPSALRTRYGISPSEPVVLYSGSLGEKQGAEFLLSAAQQVAEARFVICGDGPACQPLKDASAGLSNITFLPLQPAALLPSLLAMADLHVLPQREGTADSVFPSKLTGMLASGRPVVAMASPQSQIAEIVDGCGVIVPCADTGAFVRAIRGLLNDPFARAAFGRQARTKASEHFQKSEILMAFEAELFARSGLTPQPAKDATFEHSSPA